MPHKPKEEKRYDFFDDFYMLLDPLNDPFDPVTHLIYEDVTEEKDSDDWDD